MTKIEWNKVTWYSKLAALICGLLFFVSGIYIGMQYQQYRDLQTATSTFVLTTPTPLHCGGFIAHPETCPTGYTCKLGNIPDAGGTCVKSS